jgi:hypothetical protein
MSEPGMQRNKSPARFTRLRAQFVMERDLFLV